MNPENDTLRVERVANGWTVVAASWRGMRDGDCPSGIFVARTPAELAQLLLEWASAQDKK